MLSNTPTTVLMADICCSAVIEAKGAAGAQMLLVGLGLNGSATQEHRRVATAAGVSGMRSAICPLLNADEAVLIETPAADRIVSASDEWPGAREADVPNYIAEQLSSASEAGGETGI